MKTLFKNEVTQFPKITLTELINKSLMNNKGKSLRNSSNIKDSISNRNPNNGLLSVQEPFYIDRYKMHVHSECHEQGKCLACQYDKLKPFQMANKKKLFPLTSRQRNQIFRSQRVSETGLASTKSLKKQQSYEQNMNGLTTYIKNQMKKINRKAKQKFALSTKRRCSQNEIIALCIQFLLNPDKKFDKQNCDQESRNKLKQILNSITRYSIQKLITDPGFIKYVVQYNIPSEQGPNISRKKNKVKKQCSIREIVLQDNEAVVIHSGERKTQDKRKGVIFSDLESLANELHSSTHSLCTSYFIEQDIELTDEVKKKLEQIAYKSNAQFKAALSAIYDFLQKMNQSGCASPNISQKLQMAVEFIKGKIPKKDKDRKKKLTELDNLLSEYRNCMENSKKKEMQKQRSNKMLAANSRFYNTKDNTHDGQTQKMVVRTRPRRKQQRRKKQQHEMIEAHSEKKSEEQFQNQRNESLKLQDGVEQIENRSRSEHQSQDQQYYEISDKNMYKSSLKISDSKSDARRTSLNQISLKFKHPETEIEKRPSMRHNSKISHKLKDRQTPDSESRQQIMAKITQGSETEQTQKQLKTQEQQNTLETSQKRKKALLRIKAAELLKQNQQLIKFTEKVLRNMNLNKYVINQNDCLLVQKKKVRHLRELIRLRMQNGEAPEDLVNQILQYLSVFEDNYFFLLQKTPDSYGEQFSHGLQFNFRQVINKKQVYKDFNFYKMNDDYIFGQAEEEEMNFSFKNAKFDKSWQIMSVKNLQRKLNDRQILPAKSIDIARPSFNDLIQTDLPSVSNSKVYGIGRVLEEQLSRKEKQKILQSMKSQERVLLTENQ